MFSVQEVSELSLDNLTLALRLRQKMMWTYHDMGNNLLLGGHGKTQPVSHLVCRLYHERDSFLSPGTVELAGRSHAILVILSNSVLVFLSCY